MSTVAPARPAAPPGIWRHAAHGACALAAGMGVGRFVYTPILPVMTAQAGLSASGGATLATANYAGYLAGALIGMARPALVRSTAAHRAALVVLVVSLAGMPLTDDLALWFAWRLVAGAASALVFVYATSSLFRHARGRAGWGFGGVGAGIALSGALVLPLDAIGDWRTAWWISALLCAALSAGAWPLRPADANSAAGPSTTRTHRWFSALFVSYTLEGIGYIIAGTFLVAAVTQSASAGVGGIAWLVVGATAAPSAVGWSRLSRRFGHPDLLATALLLQAIGIALPALFGGIAAALAAAALFGASFLGVSMMALDTGTHLRFPRPIPLLTAGYSGGQIVGPLLAAPLLHHGYRPALVLAATIVLAAATAAALLRIRFPPGTPPTLRP